jgi:hypothetical protein
MSLLKYLLIDLECELLDGNERVREMLLQLDAPQALWNIDERFEQLAQFLSMGWSIVPQAPAEKNRAFDGNRTNRCRRR